MNTNETLAAKLTKGLETDVTVTFDHHQFFTITPSHSDRSFNVFATGGKFEAGYKSDRFGDFIATYKSQRDLKAALAAELGV